MKKHTDGSDGNQHKGNVPNKKEYAERQRKFVSESYQAAGGNISETSRLTGLTRSMVRKHLTKAGVDVSKPLVSGTPLGTVAEKLPNPPAGRIRRYLLTSAQNNTPLNEKMWASLNALARHYDAAIMVGTYTYNTNAYGPLAVKRGREHGKITSLWYDPRLEEHIVDRRIELGNGLVWCGEMNILPTAVDPLSGLETFAHRKSAIFPHAKLAMRSIPTMLGEWAKINYTTGTVTQSNYIQKKEGIKAEHHHSYSALLVEVNDKGSWFVRQVHANSQTGEMRDLDVVADGDKVTTGNRVEAITWGDLHATMADEDVVASSQQMLNYLRPKVQFLHDIMEGASTSRHQLKDKNPHVAFDRWMRGLHRVEVELQKTRDVVQGYLRPWCTTVVPDSNHDGLWLKNWLAKFDYRVDPGNSEIFLQLQQFMYAQLRKGLRPRDVNLLQYAMDITGPGLLPVKFLLADESLLICDGRIECGMHGHLGSNGAKGTPRNLKIVGRRANVAHSHSAGIYDGLYVAGTSSKLKWDYNCGPSSWNHSHIITYPNGSRSIVTMYKGGWRA